MFCTECGYKLGESDVFCPNCGTKVAAEETAAEAAKAVEEVKPAAEAPKAAEEVKPAPEATKAVEEAKPAPEATKAAEEVKPATEAPKAAPKKSKMGLVIGICCAVFVIALVAGGIFVVKIAFGGDAKKTSQTEGDDHDEDETKESTRAEASSSADVTEEDDKSSETPVESSDTPSEEPALNAAEVFGSFETIRLERMPKIEMGVSYHASYVDVEEWYGPVSQFDPSTIGQVKTVIRDMDGDGKDEMLAIDVASGSIEYWIYELRGSSVEPADNYNWYRKPNSTAIFDNNDELDMHVWLHQHNGKYYLIERFDAHKDWEVGYDGTYLGILGYDNDQWHIEYQKYCSGMDETSFKADDDYRRVLRDLGLVRSAEKCVYVGDDLVAEDGAEELFYVKGFMTEDEKAINHAVYNPEARNIDSLSFVSYYFFDTEKACQDALYGTKALSGNNIYAYEITRHDHSIPDTEELGGIVNYCDHLLFRGVDDDATWWLNGVVEEAVSKYDDASIEATLQAEYKIKAESPYPQEVYYYQPLDVVSVYAEGDYVSIGFSWSWFMGGVSNGGGFGLNYDVEKRSNLALEEVLGMGEKDTFNLVLEKINDGMGMENDEGFRFALQKYLDENGGAYPFWFDADNVYLLFESYSLDQGGWAIEAVIPRTGR